MFDRLIESNSAEAEFKPRRKFFMVSTVVVGIMFLSALMISLYAQKLDLGTESFELSAIMAPVPDTPEPEPPREQSQERQETSSQETDVPIRQQAIAQLDQNTRVPDAISTVPNRFREIPDGPFKLDPNAVDRDATGSSRQLTETGTSSAGPPEADESEVVRTPPPPAITKPAPKRVVSKGVINGSATSLPKPIYPPTAKAINLTGSVTVQVLIDESGNVVSAKAINGHMFFRQGSEQAASRAKFKPTYLGDQAVRVTGMIVYNFTK